MRITLAAFWHRPSFRDPRIERKVSWLELFYDLVYVVVIAQLAHELAHHPDIDGLRRFAFLFLPVWFSWITSVYYVDTFETYDFSIRVFTGLQMFAVGGMAIYATTGLDEGSAGFAISYTVHHGLTTLMFLRAWMVRDRSVQGLGRAIALAVTMFGASSAIFLVSVFVPSPIRFYLWGVALLVDFLAPVIFAAIVNSSMEDAQPTSAKMVERFGLMTIIVLGESVAGIVSGMAELTELGTRALSLSLVTGGIAFWFWWQYFDTVSARGVRDGIWNRQLWTYLHLLLFLSLTAFGASILVTLEGLSHAATAATHFDPPWLMVGSFAVAIISMGLMEPAFAEHPHPGIRANQMRTVSLIKIASGLVSLVLIPVGRSVAPTTILLALLGIQLLSYAYPWYIWARANQDLIDGGQAPVGRSADNV